MSNRSNLEALASRHGVRDLYAFGSRADEIAAWVKGEPPAAAAPHADVDFAVQPEPGRLADAQSRVRLAAELEDLVEAPRVDLIILSEASAFLAMEVVRGEMLYTSDPLAQAEHELYVMRRAADLAPFRRERVRMILDEGAR
jgi:predicted nucleotidyltransferase